MRIDAIANRLGLSAWRVLVPVWFGSAFLYGALIAWGGHDWWWKALAFAALVTLVAPAIHVFEVMARTGKSPWRQDGTARPSELGSRHESA